MLVVTASHCPLLSFRLPFRLSSEQFNKLERIEIGGTKGKVLTNGIKAIHSDFTAAVEKFKAVEYDVMDTDAKQFDEDFYTFRVVIKELERRLAAIIIQVGASCWCGGTRGLEWLQPGRQDVAGAWRQCCQDARRLVSRGRPGGF